jgi:3-oxoacyl-[acyl-carrier-protein] synthase-3
MIRSVITGTGSCIPEIRITNDQFIDNQFFERGNSKLLNNNRNVIEKFRDITGIIERRYARPDQKASDLAVIAALEAIESSGVDPETLDYIIVAHNFGDIAPQTNRISMVPSLASRVKALLRIKNPDCVGYDIAFGCPGWLEGMIQANYYIRSGDAKKCLVIGTETLSRVIDPHDRDSMLYSDGSGAVMLEAFEGTEKGIVATKSKTFASDYSDLLAMDLSYSPNTTNKGDLYLKMNGRKVYEFALSSVPEVVKETLDKANLTLDSISKVLIHQANDKMDAAILERIFKLYGKEVIPEAIMPMTISWLGNSSVATVPTLLDLVLKGQMAGQAINPGDKVVMASVGAGMNINALVYQF